MLDLLDTLSALQQEGTMGKAAARLRVTQSAVSKRIAALEAETGEKMVVPDGRRVRLSPAGERILAETAPVVAELRAILSAHPAVAQRLTVAASESLLSSWLPAALRKVEGETGLKLVLHAHRGPSLLARVRSGIYALGVCVEAGDSDLGSVPLGEEAMGVVPGGGPEEEVWTIEADSLTWAAIGGRLRRRHPGLRVVGRLESFTALVQMAKAGFGNALVPKGAADAMGATFVPLPGVGRPIVVVGRPRTLQGPLAQSFVAALRVAVEGSW